MLQLQEASTRSLKFHNSLCNIHALTNVTGFHSAALVSSLPGSSNVIATALLNGQLFVNRYAVAGVLVYDTQTLSLLRQISFCGLGSYSYGLATEITLRSTELIFR